MKVIIALLFVASFAAAQQGRGDHRNVEITKLEFENDGLGTYHHALETSDGAKIAAQGQLKSFGTEQAVVTQGSYSFVGEDGQTYTVTYTADETGFHPQGAHLPRTA